MAQYTGHKGFTFYRDYYESAVILPDKHRLAVYDSIMRYGFERDDHDCSTGDAVADAIFALIKPSLDKSLKKSKAGAKGGKSRRSVDEPGGEQNGSKTGANGKQATVRPEANVMQTVIRDDNETNIKHLDADSKSLFFDEFWKAYPRKVGKIAARKAWDKVNPSAGLHARILEAVASQKKSQQWQCDNGQYIPHPTTWLNEGRWDDEALAFRKKSRFANYTEREYPEDFFDQFVTN